MSRFVLDTAVTMSWCFNDEATELSKTLLAQLANFTDTAIVPALWLYEVANVAELAVRKGRITEQKAREFLASLTDLPIEIENPTQAGVFVAVRALATNRNLTAYDASYLELAIRHNLPLATFDSFFSESGASSGH